ERRFSMTVRKHKLAGMRVTTLVAALMTAYGSAAVADPEGPIKCPTTCNPAENTWFEGDSISSSYTWVVQAVDGSELTLTGGGVTAQSNKNRAVGAASGATVDMNGVNVGTFADSDDGYWGNHGVQAHGAGSTVNITGGKIETLGKYSNGIQAEQTGQVYAKDV